MQKARNVVSDGPMTADATALSRTLTAIDGRGYGVYKQLKGSYDLGACRLVVDHVQVDPYAPPSLMRIVVDRARADLPQDLLSDHRGQVAATDFLARAVARAAAELGEGISAGAPGQEVLERTSVALTSEGVDARLAVPLPAAGRRIRGREAARLLTEHLPRLAEAALLHASLDASALRDHVTLHRDQEALRDQLTGRGLVAFVGDGAILPRRSGDSDLPLADGAVPFVSPDSLRVWFDLPSGRRVSGMGVPDGVTVIVGGGYHGKSTVLRALAKGVYPHRAGDGREWVITRATAAALRAEDGRAVTGVDISPFLTGLPSGTDTRAFSTTNASGMCVARTGPSGWKRVTHWWIGRPCSSARRIASSRTRSRSGSRPVVSTSITAKRGVPDGAGGCDADGAEARPRKRSSSPTRILSGQGW